MYKLSEDIAIVQSLDFFTPIVDDPFTFGQITAANAFSDLYAMGAEPKTALNIVAFPVDDMDNSVLREILRGGLSKIEESGAVLAGGHSIKDDELKYGLSVTGVVHPSKMISNGGAQKGDALVLTKPLGTGIVATALKRKVALPEESRAMIDSMVKLNKYAAEVVSRYPVHAMTDVTGYGLVGHLLEMLDSSEMDAKIFIDQLPVLPGTLKYAEQNVVPGGLKSNYKFYKPRLAVGSGVTSIEQLLVVDPQTSGGLLVSLPMEAAEAFVDDLHAHGVAEACIIGEISNSSEEPHISLQK